MTLPPALQPLQCNHPDCTLPQGGRCARQSEFAEEPLVACPSLLRGPAAALAPQPSAPAPVLPDDAAPWRGRHLTLAEAEALVQRSPARLISVLGPHDAGKTSLMASFFLQIANGQYGAFPYRFASSRTLYGFQDLIERANRYSGKLGEQAVGHTPKVDSPEAGHFLHLGFRPREASDDRHVDVLLTDVAGEWVEEWTRLSDEQSRRRLSFVRRSDAFVVVVDAYEMLGRAGAREDGRIAALIRRVTSEVTSRIRRPGLALVFAKFDRVVDRVTPPEAEARIQRDAWGLLGKAAARTWPALEHARRVGFEVVPFAVSAFPRPLAEGQPIGLMDPFIHVMACADCRDPWPRRSLPVPEGASYFQAMRRWGAEP